MTKVSMNVYLHRILMLLWFHEIIFKQFSIIYRLGLCLNRYVSRKIINSLTTNYSETLDYGKVPKDYKRFLNIPKDCEKFQMILKDSKWCQMILRKIPRILKGSKGFQKILKNSERVRNRKKNEQKAEEISSQKHTRSSHDSICSILHS